MEMALFNPCSTKLDEFKENAVIVWPDSEPGGSASLAGSGSGGMGVGRCGGPIWDRVGWCPSGAGRDGACRGVLLCVSSVVSVFAKKAAGPVVRNWFSICNTLFFSSNSLILADSVGEGPPGSGCSPR